MTYLALALAVLHLFILALIHGALCSIVRHLREANENRTARHESQFGDRQARVAEWEERKKANKEVAARCEAASAFRGAGREERRDRKGGSE